MLPIAECRSNDDNLSPETDSQWLCFDVEEPSRVYVLYGAFRRAGGTPCLCSPSNRGTLMPSCAGF